MTGRPITYPGQQVVNGILILAIVALAVWFSSSPSQHSAVGFGSRWAPRCARRALRAADRRRRYAGRDLAAQLVHGLRGGDDRFVLNNNVLIISGALVGAWARCSRCSMGKAMNRSVTNVLFGAFGAMQAEQRRRRPAGKFARSAPTMSRRCSRMPTKSSSCRATEWPSRKPSTASELADQLEKRGVEVKYAIHPVAGRMPGHMNVLLAEANVPYTALSTWTTSIPSSTHRRCALIGANDVTNPAARTTRVRRSTACRFSTSTSENIIVLKRSMTLGLRRHRQPALRDPNTSMLFGDAKASVDALTAAVKAL